MLLKTLLCIYTIYVQADSCSQQTLQSSLGKPLPLQEITLTPNFWLRNSCVKNSQKIVGFCDWILSANEVRQAGHPLGMSGARIVYSAAVELQKQKKKFALATMCVGVGQGYAVVLENVSG